MYLGITTTNVFGLDDYTKQKFMELVNVYNKHYPANEIKDRYYEGRIRLHEVNLGIALPKQFAGLEIGCAWGAKTVDVLAARSMFDGFVGANGAEVEELDKLVQDNQLVAEYQAGISVCSTVTVPQTVHFLPSVRPVSVQVASAPGTTSSVWPLASSL